MPIERLTRETAERVKPKDTLWTVLGRLLTVQERVDVGEAPLFLMSDQQCYYFDELFQWV